MSKKSTKPGEQSKVKPKPRVVIDWDSDRNFTIYADPGLDVFSRSKHIPEDCLYRFSPDPIPSGWLDRPFGYRGDGSPAEQTAMIIAEVFDKRRKCGR